MTIKDKYGFTIEVGNTLEFRRSIDCDYIVVNGQPMDVRDISRIESEEDDEEI